MVKLKKVLAVTLGAALMIGSLAGCGNNSSKSADADSMQHRIYQ